MRTFLLNFITLVMLSLVVSACGKRPQVVTGIQVQTSTLNQDVLLSLKADLNLGNMTFPAVTLPVLHPKGQTQIGSVQLMPVLGGKNQIKISLNVSAVSDLQATQSYLPNGQIVPLIANNPTITIPLGAGANIYLTLGADAVALGVAVPIKQFDGIGSAVGSINLFPVFSIDKVIGAAGIFTGSQVGQNGFALVADVTQYVKMQDIFVPEQSVDLAYSSQIPSAAKEEKVNAMIFDLNRKKVRLQLGR
jgi:hypothetical protein